MSVSRSEGSLPFFAFFDSYEAVGSLEVKFQEDSCSLDPIHEFIYLWQWVSIFDCNTVKVLVVNT